jgi:hypothetical protein
MLCGRRQNSDIVLATIFLCCFLLQTFQLLKFNNAEQMVEPIFTGLRTLCIMSNYKLQNAKMLKTF